MENDKIAADALHHAVGYGRLSVGLAVLLNGAALIALPALGTLIDLNLHRVGISLFIIGLIAAALCTVGAFAHFWVLSAHHAARASNRADGIAEGGQRWLAVTLVACFVSGGISYFAFIGGCLYFMAANA